MNRFSGDTSLVGQLWDGNDEEEIPIPFSFQQELLFLPLTLAFLTSPGPRLTSFSPTG